MDLENLPSNSNSKKQSTENTERKEKKEIHQIVSAKKKKTGTVGKFFKNMIARDIKPEAIEDVIVSVIKRGISDAVMNTLDVIFYNGVQTKKRRGSGFSTPYINYSGYSSSDSDRYGLSTGQNKQEQSKGYFFDDVVLRTRREAEDVISELASIADEYNGKASVGALNQLIGAEIKWTDESWGWTKNDIITKTKIKAVRDGFLLRMPEAKSIN